MNLGRITAVSVEPVTFWMVEEIGAVCYVIVVTAGTGADKYEQGEKRNETVSRPRGGSSGSISALGARFACPRTSSRTWSADTYDAIFTELPVFFGRPDIGPAVVPSPAFLSSSSSLVAQRLPIRRAR